MILKCLLCNKSLIGKQRKFCSNYCKYTYHNDKEKMKQYYLDNKQRLNKKSKEWKIKNLEKSRKLERLWREGNKHTEKYKKQKIEMNKKMKEKYPEKYKARYKAKSYFKNRKNLLSPFCSMCRCEKNLQKHHQNYKKPLEIIRLCRECHNDLHTEIRRREIEKEKQK